MPDVSAAADPAATPKRTASVNSRPIRRKWTTPATIASPHPTVLSTAAIGGVAYHHGDPLRDTRTAPVDPKEISREATSPVAKTSCAASTISVLVRNGVPTSDSSSRRLGFMSVAGPRTLSANAGMAQSTTTLRGCSASWHWRYQSGGTPVFSRPDSTKKSAFDSTRVVLIRASSLPLSRGPGRTTRYSTWELWS